MKKLVITLLCFLAIILYADLIKVYAQVEMIGDTIQLQINGYKSGDIQWQFSKDLNNWIDIPNSNSSSLTYKIVQSGNFVCKVSYCEKKTVSDTTHVEVCPFKISESFFNDRIYEKEKLAVFKIEDFNFCNVKVPDNYEQSQTHPSIIYIKSGWKGFDHWLVTTPYPFANSNFENPCLYFANKKNDSTPPTVFFSSPSNPFQLKPMDNGGFNSDPDIIFHSDTLYCLFREWSQGKITFYIKGTADGINWSKNTKILSTNIDYEFGYVSPSIIYDNNKFRIFYAKTDSRASTKGKFYNFSIIESDNIRGPYKYIEPSYFNHKGSIELWHFDIFSYNDILYMVLCALNSKRDMLRTYLAVSYDKKNFNIFPRPLFDSYHTYRPTFYINDKGLFVLYLSTVDSKSKFYSVDGREIGVVTKDFRELLEILQDNQ